MYLSFCISLLAVETFFRSEGFADCKFEIQQKNGENEYTEDSGLDSRPCRIISSACLWNWLRGFSIPLSNGDMKLVPRVKSGVEMKLTFRVHQDATEVKLRTDTFPVRFRYSLVLN